MSEAMREVIIGVLCSPRPMTAPQAADAIIAALSGAQQGEVGKIVSIDGYNFISMEDDILRELPADTKLYTAPQPAQVPEIVVTALESSRKSLATYGEHPIIESHISKALAAITAAPSGDAKPMGDDSELPGMWSQSDLSGGATDCAPKHHTLKTDPAVFDRSIMGRKPWEIRLNDRDFQVGDTVTLQETKHSGADMRNGAPLEFTGNELTGQITYVLRGPKYGLADGWCIFSLDSGDAKREALPITEYIVTSEDEDVVCPEAEGIEPALATLDYMESQSPDTAWHLVAVIDAARLRQSSDGDDSEGVE